MLNTHRLARLANTGLIAAGITTLVVLATGGARLRVGNLVIGPWGAGLPACLFFAFAALRLVASRRSGGLEGWLVSFYARLGLPPRDAPATWRSGLRTGFLLGGGAGVVAAAGEAAAALAREGVARPFEALLLVLVELVTGAVVAGLVGAGIAAVLLGASRLRGGRVPGGYELGRRTVIGLLVVLPPLLLMLRPAGSAALAPAALLGATLAMLATAVLVVLLVPAAYLRARDGRWGLAVVGGGISAVLLGLLAVSRFSGGGAPPPPAGVGQPNVLLVTLTGVRTDQVGPWSGERGLMPRLARLARVGTVFREPISPSTWPPAAAASLLCGVYPRRHGLRAPGDRLGPRLDCLPEVLAAHGWTTAAFVSSREFDGRRTGFDVLFGEYRDTANLVRSLRSVPLGRIAGLFLPRPVEPRPGGSTVATFRDWIVRRGDEPWFAWVELADPWRPHLPPGEPEAGSGTGAGAGSRSVLDPPPAWALPRERHASPRAWSRAWGLAVRRADEQLGAILGFLRTWGFEGRTLVIVTGEAGVTLGEDGTWLGMGHSLPEAVIHRPLLLVGPGVPAHHAVGGVASLVDVMPTLLGTLGFEKEGGEEGMDLSRFVRAIHAAGTDRTWGLAFSECPLPPGPGGRPRMVVGARLGGYKIVRFPGGREEFRVAGAGRERSLLRVNPRLRLQLERQLEAFAADRRTPRR